MQIIKDLQEGNERYIEKTKNELKKHIDGQNPRIAVLTCSDSRVIPEFIFNKKIGEIFVVRVAGNIALDTSVISSLEYAVDHLKIDLLIILAHSNCGAVKAAEECNMNCGNLLKEIQKGFSYDNNHIIGNLRRQLELLPKRSKIINQAIKNKKISFVGAFYNLDTGMVEFFNKK